MVDSFRGCYGVPVVQPSLFDYRALHAENRRLGLGYGLIAASAFALTAWVFDAVGMAGAHAQTPWLKLVLGIPLCLAAGAFAGWLTAALDSPLAGIVLWALMGGGFSWLAVHLPYEGQSLLLGVLNPRFLALQVFPPVDGIASALQVLILVAGVLAAITGALEMTMLDMARGAAGRFARFLSLGLTAPLMILAGVSANTIANWPLLAPLRATDRVIQIALQAQSTPLSREDALALHLAALNPLRDLINRPRQLSLSGYDSDLGAFGVEINLGGTWGRCFVVGDQVSFCTQTEAIYQEGMSCLLGNESLDSSRCSIDVDDDARQWLLEHRQSLGASPPVALLDRLGTVALLTLTARDGSRFTCEARWVQPPIVEWCRASAG